ncbi:O-glycosyl hydrolase [Edaphobacter aggregans]|uniref:O-glycosyl hydrolase n=2 Tax=Edaphobacter aggregans TaxID=570835 RepID=A0A3R9NY36_9BACT|nr:O-glycosyl hydrolase [Edaphobacter aggregans]
MAMTRRSFLRTSAGMAALGYAGGLYATEKPAAAGIATTPDHYRQLIDGFGFSEAFHAARTIRLLEEKDQNNLLNLMFSPNGGMGYSILRNEIGDGPEGAGKTDGTVASIEPKSAEFNWTGDEDQIWLMNEAKKRGCARFMSSAWSPPAWMKSNGDSYAGELKPAMYQQYADYLATYVLEYKKRYDLDIYAISPANEPNFTPTQKYASCRWTGGQMAKFLRQNLIPTFEAKGVSAKIVINEHEHWSDDMINEILADPVCDKAIQIAAAHAYAPTSAPYVSISARTGRFSTALDKKKAIWETEVSAGDANITNMNDGVYWARVVHTHMIEDDVSAWLYWWGAATTTSRSSLIAIDVPNKKYQLSKRFFTIGHFSRFIRPGFHRVDASPTPAPNTYFSAYIDPTGKRLVCVAINDDAVERPLTIQCGGFNATTCTAVRTSNTETHAKLPTIAATNGQIEVTTTPLSVTTFIIT